MKNLIAFLCVLCAAHIGEAKATEPIHLYFSYNNSTTGDGTKVNTLETVFNERSLPYVASIDTCTYVYTGRIMNGTTYEDSIISNLKFGDSSHAGRLKFKLANPTYVDSIVIRAAMYDTAEGDSGFVINNQHKTLSAGKRVLENITFTTSSLVRSIDITNANATRGRFYLSSILIYPSKNNQYLITEVEEGDVFDMGCVPPAVGQDSCFLSKILKVYGNKLTEDIVYAHTNQLFTLTGELSRDGGDLNIQFKAPSIKSTYWDTINVTSSGLSQIIPIKVKIALPSGITQRGDSVFVGDDTNVTGWEFHENNSIKYVYIGDNCIFKNWAFYGCENIQYVEIGNNCAFNDCSFESIGGNVAGGTTVFMGYNNVRSSLGFDRGNVSVIHIPCGAYEGYAVDWGMYNIKEPEPIYNYQFLSSDGGMVSYSPEIECDSYETTLEAMPDYSYHFVQWSDSVTDNPRTIYLTQDTTFTAEFAKNPIITYNYDSQIGYVNGPTTTKTGVATDSISFEAIPNHGYHFVQWSDGITDNPRTIYLTQDTTFTAIFAQTFSGQCGDNLYWAFANDTLKFSGNGAMYDYSMEIAPWALFASETQYIEFAPEMTSISDFVFQDMAKMRKLNLPSEIATIGVGAFVNCSSITKLTIPNSVTSLGAGAFYGCSSIDSLIIGTGITSITDQFRGCTGLRCLQLGQNVQSIDYGSFYDARQLISIVCHPTLPPMAYPDEVGKERSFYNTNAQVLIPCDNFDAYKYDALWGSFNLKCQTSNSGTAVDGQVMVVVGDADATFTWPTDGSAETYNLEITKEDAVFCTLTFNSQGQLLGIHFAPSRNGITQHIPSATLAANGMSFQVTGLDYASQYRFSFETKNEVQTIFAYTGGFHTNGTGAPEGIDDLSAEGSAPRKVMIDGNVYILRGEKVYTLQGQEVR